MDILENSGHWSNAFNNGWLKHLQETGKVDWSTYKHPANENSPTGSGVDLAASRLLLVTSSGAYLKDHQSRFDTDDLVGDYTFRILPTQVSANDLGYAHGHYDDTMIRQDLQVGIPVRHLNNLVREGKLGSLTSSSASFMGYQPDSAKVASEMAPLLLDFAKEQGASAALFAPL